jgi:hypothetical protein
MISGCDHAPSVWRNPDFRLRGPSAAPGCGDNLLEFIVYEP